MDVIRPKTWDAIVQAGFEVFSRNPGASLAEVAEHAGVGRATLHRHFSSRDDLMVALAHAAISEIEETMEEATKTADTVVEGFRLAMKAVIPLAERQWFLSHEPVEKDPSVAEALAKSQRDLHKDIQAAQAEGSFSAELSPEWIGRIYEHLIYAAWDSVREGQTTVSQAADLAWKTFYHGIAT